MKYAAPLSAILLLSLSCCTSEPDLAPEAVIQQWQGHIDKNRFADAGKLSTDEALRYVNELARVNEKDTLPWENNVLLNLRCQIVGDSAFCTYHFEDEWGEPIPGQLALRRVKGHWLVSRTFTDDAPAVNDGGPDGDALFPQDTMNEVLE
ncbi:MAG: hypothetical protein R2791_05485 [Saprospiraceae bacterium]|nr:hypothetical protein [Saprospiraceae bacterium]MCB9356385.1 hypothetical protein [Lewinellaceae bacterium]